MLLLLLLLLLKTAAQAQVGEINLFLNFFRNPTSAFHSENWKKTQLMEATYGSLHP